MYPADGSPADLPPEPEPGRTLADVRIDSAHTHPAEAGQGAPARLEHGHAGAHGLAPSLRVGEVGATAQQLRTQAVQLADHLAGRHGDLERREADLQARAAELEAGLSKARAWFTQREADLQKLRQRWIDEHRQAQAQLDAARRQIEEERRRDWSELHAKRLALQRRSEQVDCAQAALQRVREDVAREHRESLLAQVAHEELRAQLAPLVPADAQHRALQRIRAKLSAEYRRANEELSRQKQELLALRRDLAEQHAVMARQCDRLQRLAERAAGRRSA